MAVGKTKEGKETIKNKAAGGKKADLTIKNTTGEKVEEGQMKRCSNLKY